jgi:hypothetical protein
MRKNENRSFGFLEKFPPETVTKGRNLLNIISLLSGLITIGMVASNLQVMPLFYVFFGIILWGLINAFYTAISRTPINHYLSRPEPICPFCKTPLHAKSYHCGTCGRDFK